MGVVWRLAVLLAAASAARAQPAQTAVYTLADHHTTRFTEDRDPLAKMAGACRIGPGDPLPTLACGPPPAGRRIGGRHFYAFALFRDLEENLYLAACSATARDTPCSLIRAGQTFTAEVDDTQIRIVIAGAQLPLRIMEARPRPISIDSPTRGAPSAVRAASGAPSSPSWSKVSESRGAPSDVAPSAAPESAGAPTRLSRSEVSTAASSPTAGRLYLYCPAATARVWVDGRWVGPPPLEIPVIPGRHSVLVRAAGFKDWSQTVQVPAGGSVRLTAELERR